MQFLHCFFRRLRKADSEGSQCCISVPCVPWRDSWLDSYLDHGDVSVQHGKGEGSPVAAVGMHRGVSWRGTGHLQKGSRHSFPTAASLPSSPALHRTSFFLWEWQAQGMGTWAMQSTLPPPLTLPHPLGLFNGLTGFSLCQLLLPFPSLCPSDLPVPILIGTTKSSKRFWRFSPHSQISEAMVSERNALLEASRTEAFISDFRPPPVILQINNCGQRVTHWYI